MSCDVVPKPYWILTSAERKFAELDASDFSGEQGVEVCNKKQYMTIGVILDFISAGYPAVITRRARTHPSHFSHINPLRYNWKNIIRLNKYLKCTLIQR